MWKGKISLEDIEKGSCCYSSREMKVIDKNLLDEVSVQAKESPRLRMNYNFHQSLDEKCHRLGDTERGMA